MTLKQLLGLCEHKWIILGKGRRMEDGYCVGTYYELQCEKCGIVKVKNLS